jgi:hypothetical protein
MTGVDIAGIARRWPALSNARRSRLLQQLTAEEKLRLKQAVRETKRTSASGKLN